MPDQQRRTRDRRFQYVRTESANSTNRRRSEDYGRSWNDVLFYPQYSARIDLAWTSKQRDACSSGGKRLERSVMYRNGP